MSEQTEIIDPNKAILAALNRCIIGIGKVKKEGRNPMFDSTYATLEQVLDVVNPFLHSEGLAMSQSPGYDGATQTATMILSFIDPQGNALNYCTSQLPVGKLYKKNGDIQEPNSQMGSGAQTYLARTQIGHVFRLNLSDNDGADGGRDERADRADTPPARAATLTSASKPSPAPSAAKAREGKGWDEASENGGEDEEGVFFLKGRRWELKSMNTKQLSTVAFTGSYLKKHVDMCKMELLRRAAADDSEAMAVLEANPEP